MTGKAFIASASSTRAFARTSRFARSLGLGMVAAAALTAAAPASAATYMGTVVMSGLNNPRGVGFGPDGSLYVAEAGLLQFGGPTIDVTRMGATHTFHIGTAGSISRLSGGSQQRIVTGLPSIFSPTLPGESAGPQGIAFAGSTGYTIVGFGGDPALRPPGSGLGHVYTFTGAPVAQFADVAAFESMNPGGRELNANPFHLVTSGSGLLVTDAGANTLMAVNAVGAVTLVAVLPPQFVGPPVPLSDAVPTGIAIGPDGAYYVGQLTGFPFTTGQSKVFRIALDGTISDYATGFTNITDLEFGADGSLYVLELDSNGLTTPGGSGTLTKVATDGTREMIFNGLVAPTGFTIASDGSFYVTNFSAGPPGGGQVLHIQAIPEPATWAMMIGGFGLVGGMIRRRRSVAPVLARVAG